MADIALTPEQNLAVDHIREWMKSPAPCFLLKGSAGTGKTTLIRHLIAKMAAADWQFKLMAPTGRAAHILQAKTGFDAATIHSSIYDLDDVEIFENAATSADTGLRITFSLRRADPGRCLFIVDESSMVGDIAAPQDLLQFGSDQLLTDLIEHARLKTAGWNGLSGIKILFVGDPAQLAPIGEQLSPALSEQYLREEHQLVCRSFELKQVMRQQSHSGVLERATALRDSIQAKRFNAMDLAPNGADVRGVQISEGIDVVESAIRAGEPAALIALSNAAVLELNRILRERLWGDANADLRTGDLLLVNANSRRYDLSNGDIVRVVDVSPQAEVRTVHMRGASAPVDLRFREVTLQINATNGRSVDVSCVILENLLQSREREITPEEQRALLVDFITRHSHLNRRSVEFKRAMQEDSYFNALRVKYGYALTCHKAQGGEWATVVVDFTSAPSGKQNENFFRWTYTAITRAQRTLLTIRAPKFDALSSMKWTTPEQAPRELDPEIADDPDWARWAFTQEKLFAHHRRLRDAWRAAGIEVIALRHMQYRERYRLQRGSATAQIEYTYDGKFAMGALAAAPGPASDPDLQRDALRAAHGEAEDPLTRTLQDFRSRLAAAIHGADVRIISDRPMQHRLRVTFEWQGTASAIDFLYDGKFRWTEVQEVGGSGSSNGLLDFLRMRLDG
ncbi:MAG: AAA family ATPase [Chloroflexi bacterium]|nr:AAA family ATPase [Chloroflexota bacterium]